ncbi:calcium-binding protein [Sphingobium sp. AN558]|uniref:calcium-binding protein n=1 Tax=Sphingobium sp. AN558 TaxID=3133442 RepID=UPI0030C356EB
MASILGTNNGETLTGTNGDDVITGLAGADILNGLDGNDVLNGGLGADALNGGNGTDAATYSTATSGVNVNLVAGSQPNTGEAFGDTYVSIENLIGSAFNDYLAGNAANNSIWGGAGDDTLWGFGGSINYLYGEDGTDTIVGSTAVDIMDGGTGVDILRYNGDTVSYQLSGAAVTASLKDQSVNTGDAAGDKYIAMEDLTGTIYNDILYGDDNKLNNIMGLDGDDKLYGLGGTDILIGGAGADRLDGGAGDDVADYETYRFDEFDAIGAPNNLTGVTASMLDPSKNTLDAAGDTYFDVENMAGSLLNDTLEGDNNRNVILGWAGNDILRGMGGDDTLEGMPGADALDGGAGEDTASYNTAGTLVIATWGYYTLVGQGVTASLLNPSINTNDAAGDSYVNIENLYGSGFSDTLQGNDLANTIFGQGGNDVLKGEGGNDVLEGGAGADQMFGGAGYDFATYADATSGVQIALDGSLGGYGEAIGDTFNGVEGLLGSSFDDGLLGDAFNNTIQGGAGSDFIDGLGGDDLIVGGAGGDSMSGGAGNDTVSYQSSATGLTISMQNPGLNTGEAAGDLAVGFEFLHGSEFNDSLYGYDYAAITIRGLGGNDKLYGGFANDVLIGDAGADQLDGGENYDLASYVTATSGVVANLGNSAGNTGDAAGDTYISIENLAGTNFNDTLTGNSINNTILGLDGQDILNGGDGIDDLDGGVGNDTLNGDGGNDRLFGGVGNDILNGGLGDDIIFGDAGSDSINGGDGTDLLSYDSSVSGVSFSMASGAAGTAGDALGDTFAGIENVIGSAFGDTIGGTSGNNRLLGRGGNDILIANGGEDHLEGGAGGDTLDGTSGYTYADYTEATSSVSAYMQWEAGNSGDAAGDHYISIEGMIGSSFADLLYGNGVENTLQGGDGNDWLLGDGGGDYLVGGNGSDVLSGGTGSDYMDGGDGIDVAFYRNVGPTQFTVAQYGYKNGLVDGRFYGVSVDTNFDNAINNFGEAAYDRLVNIENLWGSDYSDVLRGDDVGGQMYGFGGDDILDGRGGNDVFYGGAGKDMMTGGAGADEYFFLSYYDHVNAFGTPEPNEGGDIFTDFEHGIDHITLSRYWFGFGNIPGPAAPLSSTYADFVSPGGVTSTKPTFIWDNQARTLDFDPDGIGGSGTTHLASFQPGVVLTLSDIWTA